MAMKRTLHDCQTIDGNIHFYRGNYKKGVIEQLFRGTAIAFAWQCTGSERSIQELLSPQRAIS